jgi:tRNA threonylcarbamoyladenosine biosynthesis protein TsaB
MEGVILAIESSGELGGAAVVRAGEILAAVAVSGPRRHGAELQPCIDRACKEAGIEPAEIDVIAVNRGPGSYTGLRIGISAAEAIGYALNRPVLGVHALDVMALQYVLSAEFDTSRPVQLWPVLDARQNEVMTARCRFRDDELVRETEELLVAPGSLHEQADAGAVVFGSGVRPYAEEFNRDGLEVLDGAFELEAVSLGLQAYRQLASVPDAAALERAPVVPVYFRRVLARTIEERAKA